MSNPGDWRPFRETHAIQLCNLSIQFGQAVGDVLWHRMIDDLNDKAAALGLPDRTTGSQQPFDLPIMIVGLDLAGPETHTVSRSEAGGTVAERVQMTRDLIKYDQFIYTRWAPFRDRAEKLLRNVFSMLAGSSSLTAISCSYTDVFDFVGEGTMNGADVIDTASRYVSGAAVHPSTLWHSHCGYFDYPDPPTRRLSQVNIDALPGNIPDSKARQLKITTTIVDQFGQAESSKLSHQDVSWDLVSRHNDEQHALLKDLLAAVLTPTAAQSISLSPT